MINPFYVTPKDLAKSSLHRMLKNQTNFNQLCPLYFGTLFAVSDKVQAAKTLFKDFLN